MSLLLLILNLGGGQRLEVLDALLESILLLLGTDAFLDIIHDPVNHVPLLHSAHDVGSLELVVQTTLHLKNMRD